MLDPRIQQFTDLRAAGAGLTEIGSAFMQGFPELLMPDQVEVNAIQWGSYTEIPPVAALPVPGPTRFVKLSLIIEDVDVDLYETVLEQVDGSWVVEREIASIKTYQRAIDPDLRYEQFTVFASNNDPESGFQLVQVEHQQAGNWPIEFDVDWVGDAPVPDGGELVAQHVDAGFRPDGSTMGASTAVYAFPGRNEAELLTQASALLPTSSYDFHPQRPSTVDADGNVTTGPVWMIDGNRFAVELSTFGLQDPSTTKLKLYALFEY